MCGIAGLVFLLTKAHTLSDFISRRGSKGLRNNVLWFLAWPGLDADAFFKTTDSPAKTTTAEWCAAMIRVAGGSVLLFVAVSWTSPDLIVRGWVAMVGIILVLHFGILHMIALVWRSEGRSVVPIMDAPVRSTSLAEFWGRRWNLAFRDYSHRFVFRPAARRWNASVATWCVFLFSGLIHELAISVPAGGGFGLPLGYFLLQGLGVTTERHLVRRGLLTRGSVAGWCFTATFTIPAAYWLFHPPFVLNVIVPMLRG
jgi:alginate O-acetyltransferase complex protein AlgI